jgi:hypothetical protein
MYLDDLHIFGLAQPVATILGLSVDLRVERNVVKDDRVR